MVYCTVFKIQYLKYCTKKMGKGGDRVSRSVADVAVRADQECVHVVSEGSKFRVGIRRVILFCGVRRGHHGCLIV